MKVVLNPLKAPFGTAKFSRIRDVSYHQWEDAFAVEFDDGVCFLEPHRTVRRANRISAKSKLVRVELDDELRHGFFVHYDTGDIAEVSWSFVRERAPKKKATG